jgi:hypothetical protein
MKRTLSSCCSRDALRRRPRTAALSRAAFLLAICWPAAALRGEDVSQPAILQLFEAKWGVIEDRMADVFDAGYGRLWLPPPQRGDTGGLSVGYDVFDRFDLGAPRDETLYGTELALKTQISAAHKASVKVDAELIWNHNGFGSRTDAGFVALGGYPGFALTLPGDVNGDFHDPSLSYQSDEQNGSLFGLVDIAQEKNHQFIRQPVAVGNPANIPAGTMYNLPDPNNAQYYTDIDLGGVTLTDPVLGTTFTRYQFNQANPLAGDARAENATGLLMRNAQWMIQSIGVDGFRVDAARHFQTWVLNYLDNAVFRTNPRLNLDGSYAPVYSYSEIATGDKPQIQTYIRQNLPNRNAIDASNTTVGGNRDALDFPLFYAMRENLSGNGTQNNWHGIRNASQDLQDDGLRNGSQGVSFVDSHDAQQNYFPYLKNVAYAYTLMKPGQAVVYFNAKQFGENRDFPNDGKDDALGGFYGETITKLVDLRNSYGRGNFQERWIDEAFGDTNGDGQKSNVYVYEREKSAVVALNSRLDAGYDERTPVQTGFAAGTVLVELTGNAANATVDPTNAIPEAVRVNASGQVTLRIPRNSTHGLGYVIYGVAAPQGTLSLTNVAATLAGATPSAANNGTARLAGIDVITSSSFNVQLNTSPVTLPAPMGEANPVRDVHADGDTALVRIDDGLNVNGVAGIDNVTPGSVGYGFEEFTTTRTPGFVWDGGANVGTGSGLYVQTIDATQLSEGRHYVTVRAFRHRNASTGGDGGPAVYTDFKRTIYVDRLPPEPALVSFDPYVSDPNNNANRDLVIRSVDGTANSMRFFLDVGAALTESQILQMVQNGQGIQAGLYDRDSFVSGYTNVRKGNHAVTVVTYEPTGNYTVRRFSGIFTNGVGAGFGDPSGNGVVSPGEIIGSSSTSFETILYSQNGLFNATSDVDANGLIDNRDLFLLGPQLVSQNAVQTTLDAYDQLLVKRGDVTGDAQTGLADLSALYAAIGGAPTWTLDLDVDGAMTLADVETFVTKILRTSKGDFNLDRVVDGADYLVWQRGLSGGSRFEQGDANLDGMVNGADLAVWQSSFGAVGPIVATAAAAAVPEPATGALALWAMATIGRRRARGNMSGRRT